jgi:hypothetical protein
VIDNSIQEYFLVIAADLRRRLLPLTCLITSMTRDIRVSFNAQLYLAKSLMKVGANRISSVLCWKTYLVTEFMVHEVLEGTHSVLYRKVAVRLEQCFVSLTVAQEQEHALWQLVCVCNLKSHVNNCFI